MDQTDACAQALTLTGRQLPGVLAEHLQLTVVRSQGGGEQVEEARLARAGRSDNGDLFAGLDVQIHATQRLNAVGMGKADLGQMQRHLSSSAARAASSIPL